MDLNGLDLNLIRVFDALCREGSVTRAGQRIGLSQPAVSAALNRLRHALDDQLFVRSGMQMLPTPRAEALAPRAAAALQEIGAMLAPGPGFEPARLDRTFTLLGADFFSTLLMPTLAVRLSAEAPGLRLRLVDSARGDVARMLQDDAIDMALERPLTLPDWVRRTVLFPSPFVVIAAQGHPGLRGLAEGDRVPMDAFCGIDHAIRSIDGQMTGMIDEALAQAGRSRRVTLALPHFHSVAQAVAEGAWLAAVPVQFARAVAADMGLALYGLPIAVPVPDISLYWHDRHSDAAAHRWMRRRVTEIIAALGFTAA